MASVKARVLTALQAGPGTAAVIAARCELAVQACRVRLCQLGADGFVYRAGTVANDTSRPQTIYAIRSHP